MAKKSESGTGTVIHFEPVTADRWNDLAKLFGERGACAGCWCMCWRRAHKDYESGKGAGNKRALKRLVTSGKTPGILAYEAEKPIGWCSVAPRETFTFLSRSRALAPIDDKPVWSVTCLFIAKDFRRQGIGVALLKAAGEYVKSQGGKIVEGYPQILKKKLPDPWVWTGVLPAYIKAGYKEVKRPSAGRAIVRLVL
jgi:GNAT superfamily N-acetyltransferase